MSLDLTDVVPLVRERAAETEAARGPSAEVLAALRAAGCLRLLTPRERGGLELPLPDVLEVVRALAEGDGAVGWLVGQAAVAQLVLSRFPAEAAEACFPDGPDTVGAGAAAPKGKALPVEGGWRVSGQWPFVSGIDHARWVFLQCAVFGGEAVELRAMLVPVADVERLDTWRSLGLRGTGSHDVRVRGFCPQARSADLLTAGATPDRPAYRVPTVPYGATVVAAAALGIAAAAVAELVACSDRRPAFSRDRLADTPEHLAGVGLLTTRLRAADALLAADARTAHHAAETGRSFSGDLGRLRSAAAWCAHEARAVVDAAHRLAGGPAVYDGTPLQRHLRDVYTATQHAAVNPQAHTALGTEILRGAQP
ncbi:acyl-CoA dehydrogenase family protein [Actinosynnema sp. NPDC020468]|uniref:acyl-CoA dehydrogenase family protein n=1 Tax=Actinosynnema sp. NPDC020468 TaxID=3154488 RepID=UPI0033F13E3E